MGAKSDPLPLHMSVSQRAINLSFDDDLRRIDLRESIFLAQGVVGLRYPDALVLHSSTDHRSVGLDKCVAAFELASRNVQFPLSSSFGNSSDDDVIMLTSFLGIMNMIVN